VIPSRGGGGEFLLVTGGRAAGEVREGEGALNRTEEQGEVRALNPAAASSSVGLGRSLVEKNGKVYPISLG